MEIAIALTAIDNMTAVIRKATGASEKSLASFAAKANAVSQSAAMVGKQTAIMGVALAAPLVYATKKAIDFESAMADVAKVANLDKSSQSFKNLSNDALNLSKYLATNSTDVGKLYSSLLAGGTLQNQLSKVSKIAGEAAVAFDITQEQAGEAFSVMKNAMNLSVDETKRAFDATNAITNKFGGKAAQILEFMSQGGASVARTFKATAPEMEAFGRALMQSGVSASEAGTVMQRFRVGMYANAEAMKIFKASGGGAKGISKVFETAQASGDAFKWFKSHSFGQYASQMALLAGNGRQLGDMLKFVGIQSNYTNSATQEFNSRMDTTEMRLKKAKVAFDNAAIKAGSAFLPVLTRIVNTLTPMIEKVSKWIQRNPALTATIVKLVAGLAATLFVISSLSFAVSGFAKALSWGSSGIQFFGKGIKWLGAQVSWYSVGMRAQTALTYMWSVAQKAAAGASAFLGGAVRALNYIFVSTPIGFIAIAIASAAGLIIANWGKVQQFFANLWAGITNIFSKARDMIVEYGLYMLGPVGAIIKNWDKIQEFFSQLWPKVRKKFSDFLDYVLSIPSRMFQAGQNIVNSIGDGIKSYASKPINAIKNIVKKIRDFLPFSPAKEGALRDIHRIRLVETIAETIKPGPMIKAMRVTTAAAMLAIQPMAGKSAPRMNARPAGNSSINYAPTIQLNGGSPAVQQDLRKILSEHSKEIYRIVKSEERKQQRTNF